MEVLRIDPRDTAKEVDTPTYRVYFWEKASDDEVAGFRSDEYEVSGATDVHEVLRWATEEARERTFTIHVVVDNTLVRLSGEDPTTT